jgi:hypothetical protein
MMHNNNTKAVMFAKSLWFAISLSGMADVVARYTCFIFSLFDKQLIPNPAILLAGGI